MRQAINLFSIGSVHVTLRSLLLLLSLSAYAVYCLLSSKKRGIKPEKTAMALLCGYIGMLVLGKLSYMLLDQNAPRNPLIGGDMTFFGIVGFFAALRLYCYKSSKAFKRFLRLMAAPFFALAVVLYLLRDGAAGQVTRPGLFAYTDVYGLKRWNVPVTQACALALLMLCAALLQRFLKQPKFKIKTLPMTICALALIQPLELLRDSTQIKIFGAGAEAFFMWLTEMILLGVWLHKRLKAETLPVTRKLLSAAISIILPLLSMLSKSALLSMIMLPLPVILTLSPLFPFIKRPARSQPQKRRSFS